MKDKQRKKAQRKINKNLRRLNNAIFADNLWRGRFIFKQTNAYWSRFDDGSGGILTAVVEARDLKTGLYWEFIIDNYDMGWRLFEKANTFIAEYSEVWNDISLVKNDTTNWKKVKWIPKTKLFG